MRPLLITLLLASFACRDSIPDAKDTVVDTDKGVDTDLDTDVAVDDDGDGYAADEDCDDSSAEVNPGVAEVPYNGIDDDCDPSTVDDDLDGDGYLADEDCNDEDDAINPGVSEICNGLDDDCSGTADDAVGDLWYVDGDGDGFGDPGTEVQSCDGDNLVADATDCDDVRADINPDAVELCDGADQDCDGEIDEDPLDGVTWYADVDGDGFGDIDAVVVSCEAPPGYLSDAGDCDDGNADTNPGAQELCNTVDDDCDGLVDDEAADAPTWYADTDGDGFGDSDNALAACLPPAGFVDNTEDCDDGDGAVNPSAVELCDGVDNNCDQLTDDDSATDAVTHYTDVDGDGFGDDGAAVVACVAPAGTVTQAGDCDDAVPTVYPSATELCDGLDNDCNGDIDEVPGLEATWYRDADMDGFGNDADTVLACSQPAGFVAGPGDCDDTSGFVRPGADEICDGEDQDCDGAVDEQAVDAPEWFVDTDNDGHGAGVAVAECAAPVGHVALGDDCDDAVPTTHPGADELCNMVDDDCDGAVDNDPVDPITWWLDDDGDGYGDATSSVQACLQPAGYADDDEDCDDTDPSVRPGVTELCDEADRNCDGDATAGATDVSTWYADGDADGWGDVDDTVSSCGMPDGYVDQPGDCEDDDALVSPSADELCDGLDQDCNGVADDAAIDPSTFYADTDADGFGTSEVSQQACEAPAGFVDDATDCDDGVAEVNPGADELCDDLDRNCDGDPEAGAVDAGTVYEDLDGDGFGSTVASQACEVLPGFSDNSDDCDDADVSSNPAADELCDDVDHDCDGSTTAGATDALTWYADSDEDGQGDLTVTVEACGGPDGFVANSDDCDDLRGDVFTGADELCDDVDHDCDGDLTAGAVDPSTWFEDGDGDGQGAAASTRQSCDMPPGYVSTDTDCDDGNGAVFVGAEERCDDLDRDCDGDPIAGAVDPTTFFRDSDSDGQGDAADTRAECSVPAGYTDNDTDCDDGRGDVFVGADELCDDVDHNCDGDAVAGAIDPATWYADGDGDGFGTDVTTDACTVPSGFAETDGDCDDGAGDVNPDALETCNDRDDDCDGAVDNDPVDGLTWYEDADKDGSGSLVQSVVSCDRPDGWTEDTSDCDDDNALVEPGMEEICDGLDNDCNDQIDEGCADVIVIGPPVHEPPGDIASPGACGQLAEVDSVVDPHQIGNLTTFMDYLDGTQSGKLAETIEVVDTMDYSVRCNTQSDNLASPGNYSPTTPWPDSGVVGSRGSSRFRGYIHLEAEADLTKTIGLIGNDALRLIINGETIIEQNWSDGRWKKFRWVAFEGPGLYPFEVQWSTNFVCGIDPMELVWGDTWIPGFIQYDDMCQSSACSVTGPIHDLLPLTGEQLLRTAGGTDGSCLPCSTTADCSGGETCGAAGVCE